MKNRADLIHDLAIIDYTNYYKENGYEILQPEKRSSLSYTPDLVMTKNGKDRIYVEFKGQSSKLNQDYFEYKQRVLREDPKSEFYLIIINETHKPNLNVYVPFLKSILDKAFQEDILRVLSTDKNFIGIFEITSFSITELIIDQETVFNGDGIITYSIAYEESTRSIIDKGIETSFTFMVKVHGDEFIYQNADSVIEKKIIIDKPR